MDLSCAALALEMSIEKFHVHHPSLNAHVSSVNAEMVNNDATKQK